MVACCTYCPFLVAVFFDPFFVYASVMDAIVDKPHRVSRWSRDPVLDAKGAPVVVQPTERDIEIFKLLTRFRYLPADYIHAFVGGSVKALTRRLNVLSRKPNV